MAILLFDDSRRAPRSAVGDAVYGDDVVLSPLPRHYQKSQKKAAAATTTSITASAILWTYTCISFACNLTRVAALQRAATAATARCRALPRGKASTATRGNARCVNGALGHSRSFEMTLLSTACVGQVPISIPLKLYMHLVPFLI